MKKRKKTTRTARKNLILRLCVFAFVVYSAVRLVDMQIEIVSCRQKIESMHKAVEIQRMANNDLKRRLQEGTDESTIERIAREQLDFVWPEEKVFIDISGS